jgi:multiple sugar transport system ATP-binding protein
LGQPPINLLPAALMPEARLPRGAATIGVRTEHLQLAAPNGGPVARVHRVEHLGDQNHVHLDYRGQPLVTLADPHQPLSAGQEVGLALSDPLYFDASGQRIAPAAA